MPGLVGPAKDCEKLTRRSCGMPDPVGPAHAGLSREHRTPPPKSVLARLTGALITDASGRSDDDRLEQALREKYGCGSGQARVNQKPNPKPRLTPH